MRLTLPPALIAAALLSSAAARADSCKQIDTSIATSYVFGGWCQSPVGLCTEGTVASGPLAGSTRFTVLTMTPTANPYVLLYTGELVITTRSGTVTVSDSGIYDAAAGKYFELEQVVTGTQRFSDARGALTSQGTANGGFQGTLTGEICHAGESAEQAAR